MTTCFEGADGRTFPETRVSSVVHHHRDERRRTIVDNYHPFRSMKQIASSKRFCSAKEARRFQMSSVLEINERLVMKPGSRARTGYKDSTKPLEVGRRPDLIEVRPPSPRSRLGGRIVGSGAAITCRKS